MARPIERSEPKSDLSSSADANDAQQTQRLWCIEFQNAAFDITPKVLVWSREVSERFRQLARESHTATLRLNGSVLVTGGFGGATSTLQSLGSVLSSTEIYDPVAATWTAVVPMNSPRMNHTATLIANGKVLAACCCTAEGGRLAG